MDKYECAWDRTYKYFELHAVQRMSTFNFFIIISTILTTAYASTFSDNFDYKPVRLFSSLSLIAVSFVFWKLDERVRFLIHTSEDMLIKIENKMIKEGISQDLLIFSEEDRKFKTENKNRLPFNHKAYKGIIKERLTYSKCFNFLYFLFFLIGAIGAIQVFGSILPLTG